MAEKAIIVNTPKNKIQSDAQDWASIFNSIIGDRSGVLTYGEELNLIKKNDNTVTLHDGVYSMQGHMIQVERGSTVDLMVDSGTLGIERVDSVVVEYVKNGDRTENDTFEFKIIKGEPQTTGGNAVAPTLLQEDLLGGGLKRQERLFDLEIKGTTITVVDKREYVNSMKEQEKRFKEMINSGVTPQFKSWKEVQDVVRAGKGRSYFSIGDRFIVDFNGKEHGFDVIGINHDKPSDSRFEYSLTIQAHDALLNAQFDAPEPNNPDADIKLYGYNNYVKSNIRQWLNSFEDTFKWVSQHAYDVASTGAPYNGPGFLKLLDPELVKVLGKVDRVVARNTVTDGGGQDEYSDKVYLPTRVEIFGGTEGTTTGEAPYDYYSMMEEVANAAAVDWRVKYLDKVVRHWWLSSPNVGYSYEPRDVSTTGGVSNHTAGHAGGVAPACVII